MEVGKYGCQAHEYIIEKKRRHCFGGGRGSFGDQDTSLLPVAAAAGRSVDLGRLATLHIRSLLLVTKKNMHQ